MRKGVLVIEKIFKIFLTCSWRFLRSSKLGSGIPEFRPFGQKGKFSAFGFRFRPPKLKAEYGRNSRKALDFLLFVHENIANVNYQW